MNNQQELDVLKEKCQNCYDCPLGETRTESVFSAGNPEATIMLIGEAPGAQEDATGEPFVGRAGKLLDQLLLSQGFTRDENIYICNTVKCRPPGNRLPSKDEKAQCRKYLEAQIAIVKPRIILLCGATALKSVIDTKLGISKIRGQWFELPSYMKNIKGLEGAKTMPIFHPSYLLRNPSEKEGSPKWLMLKDIKEIRRVYDELEA